MLVLSTKIVIYNRCVRKSRTGGKAVVAVFGLRQNQPPPGISQEAASAKTWIMVIIDIGDLLPKELDLYTLARDASSTPPAPDNHDGDNETEKAAQDSPS